MKIKTHSAFNKTITLMYHRISNAETDPWEICVSPQHFEEHIQFLKNNFNVISSNEAIKQLKAQTISNDSICVTFDDGYADNYTHAKPVLEKYNCPATFFIPTAFISQNKNFWWDELEFTFLHHNKLPGELLLTIGADTITCMLDKSALTKQQWLKHKQWKWYKEPPTKRCEVFLNVWEKLRPQPHEEIQKQMTAIKEWAGVSDDEFMNCSAMNEEQLRNLSKNNLFKIDMHTDTHADLQGKEKQLQIKEIVNCKKILYNKYDIESNCLAYPYGRFDNTTIEVVKELQLNACYTTEAFCNDINSDITKLGRFQVCNWDKADFENQLTKWSK